MKFWTRDRFDKPRASDSEGAYLEANSWNDYGYRTLWTLYLVSNDTVEEIGNVKVGDRDNNTDPALPKTFTQLSQQFFSLGQEEEYYERLNMFGAAVRSEILTALNDIALDLDLFQDVTDLDVTTTSLLRWVKPVNVQAQLHRIALGGAKLSPYSFSYRTPARDRYENAVPSRTLNFEVDPSANPRTNVHVLIGQNGVGKSFILSDIAASLTRFDARGEVVFEKRDDVLLADRFSSVVSVAFSAFDAFQPKRQSRATDAVPSHYIGLRKQTSADEKTSGLKDHVALAQEFGTSLKACIESNRLDRWRQVLDLLKSDALFSDVVERMLEAGHAPDEVRGEARRIFGELSSGHKIVLLTLTRLIETVEEATLVLIDEPESHLHPPLLAAFISALSELLENRNGVAIIATHSPVVLQEVPSSCVWKLMGSDGVMTVERPSIETYGENVGTLTQDVFGLEMAASGFHRAIVEAVQDNPLSEYQELLDHFSRKLGSEARVLLQTMLRLDRRR